MDSIVELSTNKLCKLCNEVDAKYVCPRCNTPYCSLKCYQSEVHIQCSESFYKECVVSDIAEKDLDPDSQRKMLEILQRVQNIDSQFEDEELDSDDESDTDLAERLNGVDLDDADSVWQKLTDNERQEFKELLRKGDITNIIPPWEPWWSYRLEKKMVEEVNAGSKCDKLLCKDCPSLIDVMPFSTISKLTPSPCVRWNIANIIAAYIVLAWTYNGEHQSAPTEGSAIILILSTNLSSNQNFEDIELAVESVVQESINNPLFIGGIESARLKQDVSKLFSGPTEKEHNFYVLAALSDLHRMFTVAKQSLSGSNRKINSAFNKRFPESSLPATPKSKLSNCIKKIEYFLAWVKEYY